MKHIKTVNYSYKFPKLSEYTVNLFSPIFIIVLILIAIMYILSSKELKTDFLTQVILFVPTLYLSIVILIMIYKILILIRRIIRVCEENSNLSKHGHIYKNNLLVCEDKSKYYINEKKTSYFLIVGMFLFFLSKRFMIDIQYIKWGGCFVIIIFLLIRLREISHFFYDLANTCYQNIIKENKYIDAFTGKELINWKAFEYKWRKVLALNIILFLLTVLLFFTFKDYKGTISSSSLFIAAIITFKIALDVDKLVKSNLAIMSEYDAHIKNELGMIFLQPKEIIQSSFSVPVTLESSIPTFIEISKTIKTTIKKIFNK